MHPNHKQAKDSQKTKLKSMTAGYADGGTVKSIGSTPESELHRIKDSVGMSYKKIGTHSVSVGGGKSIGIRDISEKDIPHKRGGKV